MGIRFFCPQGHKLNVKSFLAGKIGVCPHCDARVKIPLTSTRPSSKAMYRDAEVPEEALPLASPLEDLDHVLEVAEIAGLSGTDSASKSPSAAGSVTELESVPADMPEPGPTDPLLQPLGQGVLLSHQRLLWPTPDALVTSSNQLSRSSWLGPP